MRIISFIYTRLTNTRFYTTKEHYSRIDNSFTKIYLYNHVCVADFFADQFIIQNCAYLSRLLVHAMLAVMSCGGYFGNSLLVFNRNSKNARQYVTQLLDNCKTDIIIYPEGTRNLKNEELSLMFI